MTENCGSTDTHSGEPCGNNPSEPDGLCHLHTKVGEQKGHKKLSHERQERIAHEIETGTPIVAACRLNDITYETHRQWMDKGKEQEEGPFAEYFARLSRALGADQSKKTEVMWEKALETGDTSLMLTVLKQRYPETWQDQDIGEAMRGTRQKIPDKLVNEWYER